MEQETEIVYVVSPDRENQLFCSLSSLLQSGSQFSLVRILCVGPIPDSWRFADPRVSAQTVTPLFGEYFFGNKLYLCEVNASRVVFLDSDTVVNRPLQDIWAGRDADFLGRSERTVALHEWGICTDSCTCGAWRPAIWSRLFKVIGCAEKPMFNTGLLVFQNGAHRRIGPSWRAFVQRFILRGLPFPSNDARMIEQWSLALAIAFDGVSCEELSPAEHGYAWLGDKQDESVVFHFGNFFWRPSPVRPDLLVGGAANLGS